MNQQSRYSSLIAEKITEAASKRNEAWNRGDAANAAVLALVQNLLMSIYQQMSEMDEREPLEHDDDEKEVDF